VRRTVLAIACLAAFLLLGALVSAGAVAGLDRFAVREAMPWQSGSRTPPTLLDEALPLYDPADERGHELGGLAAYVVTLPASPVLATAAAAALLVAVRRRAGMVAAVAWAAAYSATVAVDLAGKAVVACLAGLQLGGYHTPTDIAGGLLAGSAIVLAAHAVFPGNQLVPATIQGYAERRRERREGDLGAGPARGGTPSHDHHPGAR
jgi:hypothetical protein